MTKLRYLRIRKWKASLVSTGMCIKLNFEFSLMIALCVYCYYYQPSPIAHGNEWINWVLQIGNHNNNVFSDDIPKRMRTGKHSRVYRFRFVTPKRATLFLSLPRIWKKKWKMQFIHFYREQKKGGNGCMCGWFTAVASVGALAARTAVLRHANARQCVCSFVYKQFIRTK